MGYKIIKVLLLVLCASCSCSSPLYYGANNFTDANGIKRSIVAFRLYVDGKLIDNGYSSRFTEKFHNTEFICCSNFSYGDLIFDSASSYENHDGQKSGVWASFISIQLRPNESMQINISKELIGKNFYIDSLPFKSKQVLNISISTELKEKRSLRSKFSMVKKWKEPKYLVSKENELKFRKYFAIDTTDKRQPVYDLFNKEFYVIKYSDLKKRAYLD